MLSENKINMIIISLLLIIIVILINNSIKNRETFDTQCNNGQCFTCSNNHNYRKQYCSDNPVTRICPDGYTLNNDTKLCDKKVMYENKEYIKTARPLMECNKNELQIGDTCVTDSQYTFDPKYT